MSNCSAFCVSYGGPEALPSFSTFSTFAGTGHSGTSHTAGEAFGVASWDQTRGILRCEITQVRNGSCDREFLLMETPAMDRASDAALSLWMSRGHVLCVWRYPHLKFSKQTCSTWSHTESETHTFWRDTIPAFNPQQKMFNLKIDNHLPNPNLVPKPTYHQSNEYHQYPFRLHLFLYGFRICR